MINVITVQFWHNLAFFACIFSLRFVEDKFTINKELRRVCGVTTVCTSFYIASLVFLGDTIWVTLGIFEYLIVLNSLIMLYLTSVDPVLRSYKQTKIIPFSLSQECLRGLESAMIQPTPAKYFYDYLYLDCRDKMGLTLYAMYADLRRFMAICDAPKPD